MKSKNRHYGWEDRGEFVSRFYKAWGILYIGSRISIALLASIVVGMVTYAVVTYFQTESSPTNIALPSEEGTEVVEEPSSLNNGASIHLCVWPIRKGLGDIGAAVVAATLYNMRCNVAVLPGASEEDIAAIQKDGKKIGISWVEKGLVIVTPSIEVTRTLRSGSDVAAFLDAMGITLGIVYAKNKKNAVIFLNELKNTMKRNKDWFVCGPIEGTMIGMHAMFLPSETTNLISEEPTIRCFADDSTEIVPEETRIYDAFRKDPDQIEFIAENISKHNPVMISLRGEDED